MKTITFYSYKGGVGRTLLVANLAKYLAHFGQRVFALDFDLEAPGLRHKFGLAASGKPHSDHKGVVDLIYDFIHSETDRFPESLEGFTTEVRFDATEETSTSQSTGESYIHLMSAGDAPFIDFRKKLSSIDWKYLFYRHSDAGGKDLEPKPGIGFFLELKELIENEYNPDYLLIDSRTGITEIGGVATTLLPDLVVCMMLHNTENRIGIREVCRSIAVTPPFGNREAIEICLVLTRVPADLSLEEEEDLRRNILEFLNQDAEKLIHTLSIADLHILHSEPELEVRETIRVGGKKKLEDSRLYNDYLRLFTRIIPGDLIGKHISPLVESSVAKVDEDPLSVKRELERLAIVKPHPQVYRKLLDVYDLLKHHRRYKSIEEVKEISNDTMVSTAVQLWEFSGDLSDPIFIDIVKQYELSESSKHFGFVEEVWKAAGADNEKVGLWLAGSYVRRREQAKAFEILEMLTEKVGHKKEILEKYGDVAIAGRRWELARRLIDVSSDLFGKERSFLVLTAQYLLARNNREETQQFLDDKRYPLADLKREHFYLWARVFILGGQASVVYEVLEERLEEALNLYVEEVLSDSEEEEPEGVAFIGEKARGFTGQERLIQVGHSYKVLERQEEFITRVRQRLKSSDADHILNRFFSVPTPKQSEH